MAENIFVTIDSFQGWKSERTVTLKTKYDGKEAQITIPEAKPKYDGEPGTDVYRREVQALIVVLQEAVALPQGIRWPYRHQSSKP